jgi:phosphohistidine swiveling domain-containing protein
MDTMKFLEAYKRKGWVNVSKGHWSFLSCTDFISCYTTDLLIEGAHPFDHPVQVCSGTTSELWFLKAELDAFGERIKHINSQREIDVLLKHIEETGSAALAYIRNSKPQDFDTTKYRLLWGVLKDYYQYHLVNKYLCEFLSQDDLAKYATLLKNARVAYGEPIFNESEKLARQIIASVSHKTGVEAELLAYVTRDELSAYYTDNVLPESAALKERSKKSLIIGIPSGYAYITGKDAEEIESFLYDKTEHTVSTIKGQPAFPGKVTGVARFVKDPASGGAFLEGDILLTGMTHVDYLPLVKKASAIVTDAGGILSHAAIIARELKKPCIIGTTNATRLIPDGARIEVDADVGVITLLTN